MGKLQKCNKGRPLWPNFPEKGLKGVLLDFLMVLLFILSSVLSLQTLHYPSCLALPSISFISQFFPTCFPRDSVMASLVFILLSNVEINEHFYTFYSLHTLPSKRKLN